MSEPKPPIPENEPGKSPPAPVKEPPPSTEPGPTPPPKQRLEPTRYGDWELNGKCVDF